MSEMLLGFIMTMLVGVILLNTVSISFRVLYDAVIFEKLDKSQDFYLLGFLGSMGVIMYITSKYIELNLPPMPLLFG